MKLSKHTERIIRQLQAKEVFFLWLWLFRQNRILIKILIMLSKERFISSFIYSWKKEARDFTKIYAFQPLCENSERFLAFNSFLQKTPSQIFRWVLNTSLNQNKFFYIGIFGSKIFKCKEKRTSDVKEARKHVSM